MISPRSKKSMPFYRGFGMIEAVIGMALITIFLFAIAEVGRLGSRLIDSAGFRMQATFLIEEGFDAVRGVRDAGWAANIAPLSLDTDYWLNFSGGVWALTTTPRPFIDGRFDRRVRVSAVLRDSSDDIVTTSGATDTNSKKITVSVAWSDRGATTTSTVSTYIMNLFNN